VGYDIRDPKEFIASSQSKISRQRPRRANGAEVVQRHSAGDFSFACGGQSFCLFRSSTDWIRPSYLEDNAHSMFMGLNVNFNQVKI
jgi:hypothetical protein